MKIHLNDLSSNCHVRKKLGMKSIEISYLDEEKSIWKWRCNNYELISCDHFRNIDIARLRTDEFSISN